MATLASRFETTLQDKYALQEGWVYMTGMQALVRLPLQQKHVTRRKAGILPVISRVTGALRWGATTWSCGPQISC